MSNSSTIDLHKHAWDQAATKSAARALHRFELRNHFRVLGMGLCTIFLSVDRFEHARHLGHFVLAIMPSSMLERSLIVGDLEFNIDLSDAVSLTEQRSRSANR